MDFIRYRKVTGYWIKHPPVHLLVAAYLGYKSDSSKDDTVTLDIETLMRLGPTGVVNIAVFGGR